MVMFHPTFGLLLERPRQLHRGLSDVPDRACAVVREHDCRASLLHVGEHAAIGHARREGHVYDRRVRRGNGALAESILEYIQAQANSHVRWASFARQAVYVCYDRSAALNEIQKERNRRFGARFDGRVADATNLTATIKPGSLKGVVLSNELRRIQRPQGGPHADGCA